MQKSSVVLASVDPCRARSRRFLRNSVCAALALLGGCAGTYETISPPFGANFNPEDRSLDGQYARSELDEAARMVKAGHYAQAILRLERVVDKYGTTEAGIEARYLLAAVYEQIGGLEKARDYYESYLELAPPGPHASASAKRLAYLTGEAAEPAALEEPEVLALQEQMRAAPDDMVPPLELAEYLWGRERYNEAGALYVDLVERWPGLLTDSTVRQRITREADGTYTILTPAEVVRRTRTKYPLQVVNVQSYRSGLGSGSTFGFTDLRDRYYHVTGEVVNQGERPLRSVEVRVTLYGFGRRVFDTRTVNIGALPPGESHAFSVRFENFENIDNVQDYECVGTYVL